MGKQTFLDLHEVPQIGNYIKLYHPPVNICHLGTHIWIPIEQAYQYTKELYKKGKIERDKNHE